LARLPVGRARFGERSFDDLGRPERREARLRLRDGLRLLLGALASEPGHRHPSALVMAHALRAIVDREAERRRRARRFADVRAALRGS